MVPHEAWLTFPGNVVSLSFYEDGFSFLVNETDFPTNCQDLNPCIEGPPYQIQPYLFHLYGYCCEVDNKLRITTQVFRRKKAKLFALTSQYTWIEDGSYELFSKDLNGEPFAYDECFLRNPRNGCVIQPPLIPPYFVQFSISELSDFVDLLLLEAFIITGSKTDFFLFDPVFDGCVLDRCSNLTPGWYSEIRFGIYTLSVTRWRDLYCSPIPSQELQEYYDDFLSEFFNSILDEVFVLLPFLAELAGEFIFGSSTIGIVFEGVSELLEIEIFVCLCPPNLVCVDGTCVPQCPEGWILIDGICVDPTPPPPPDPIPPNTLPFDSVNSRGFQLQFRQLETVGSHGVVANNDVYPFVPTLSCSIVEERPYFATNRTIIPWSDLGNPFLADDPPYGKVRVVNIEDGAGFSVGDRTFPQATGQGVSIAPCVPEWSSTRLVRNDWEYLQGTDAFGVEVWEDFSRDSVSINSASGGFSGTTVIRRFTEFRIISLDYPGYALPIVFGGPGVPGDEEEDQIDWSNSAGGCTVLIEAFIETSVSASFTQLDTRTGEDVSLPILDIPALRTMIWQRTFRVDSEDVSNVVITSELVEYALTVTVMVATTPVANRVIDVRDYTPIEIGQSFSVQVESRVLCSPPPP